MNDEIDPILVGETDDIEVGTVESFEHDDINYAVYHLEPGFFCTQGNCNCEERAPLSESEIEGEELECVGCGNTYSIVSVIALVILNWIALRSLTFPKRMEIFT